MNNVPNPGSNRTGRENRSDLADSSRTASFLLSPVFGDNCRLLNRHQAFALLNAAIHAAEHGSNLYDSLDLTNDDEIYEAFLELLNPPNLVNGRLQSLGIETSPQVLALKMCDREIDLLGFAQFLLREIHLGRWSSIIEPYPSLVSADYDRGYVKKQVENLKGFRPGSANYIDTLWRIGSHLGILTIEKPPTDAQRFSMAVKVLSALAAIQPDLTHDEF